MSSRIRRSHTHVCCVEQKTLTTRTFIDLPRVMNTGNKPRCTYTLGTHTGLQAGHADAGFTAVQMYSTVSGDYSS